MIDLNKHLSITSSGEVAKIITPLSNTFNIKHFRYLKIYQDGSRVLLSNFPDCTRFMYEEGHYQKMWFDGNFPEYLKEGCHPWDLLSRVEYGREKDDFEKEINSVLGLYHGLTFVRKGDGFYENFTFDSNDPNIYHINKDLLMHFMLYFKANANKLIRASESEKILAPITKPLMLKPASADSTKITNFLNQTPINRYYLSGKYSNIYLTTKEVRCVFWLVQGKTAEETACIEGNTAKTVESHIENVKRKLNCYKQTQLISIILDTDILRTL